MPALPTPALVSALSYRSFALLWSGQAVSQLGSSIHLVALAWWVLQATGSAAAMGSVLIAASVPELLLLLVGGVLVDRVSRLRLLLGTDLARGGLMALVALLAWQGSLLLWHLLVVSALFGLASAVFYPAATAAIPAMLPVEALPSANALRSISLQLAGIAGPALGGILVAHGGTALAFALDAASFAVSALCIVGVTRCSSLAQPPPSAAGVLHDLRQGFATVLAAPWLWITIAIAGVSNVTLAGPLYAALPLLVEEELGGSASTFGLLNALSAAGAVAMALLLGQVSRLRRRGPLIYGCWIVAAVAAAVMGLPGSVMAVGLAIFVFGAAETGLGLVWMNALQELVPSERLGRVASIDALGSAALLPVGFALAGVAADRFGAGPVFVVGGTFSAAVIGLGLLHPAIRRLD